MSTKYHGNIFFKLVQQKNPASYKKIYIRNLYNIKTLFINFNELLIIKLLIITTKIRHYFTNLPKNLIMGKNACY